MPYFCTPASDGGKANQFFYCGTPAEVAHLVEHDLAKVGVAGSSPVFRSDDPLLTKRGFFFCSQE